MWSTVPAGNSASYCEILNLKSPSLGAALLLMATKFSISHKPYSMDTWNLKKKKKVKCYLERELREPIWFECWYFSKNVCLSFCTSVNTLPSIKTQVSHIKYATSFMTQAAYSDLSPGIAYATILITGAQPYWKLVVTYITHRHSTLMTMCWTS